MKKILTLILIVLAESGFSYAQSTEAQVSSPEAKAYISFLNSKYEKLISLAKAAEKQENVMAYKTLFAPGAETTLKEISAYTEDLKNHKVAYMNKNGTQALMNAIDFKESCDTLHNLILQPFLTKLNTTTNKEDIDSAFHNFLKSVENMMETLNSFN